MLGLHLKALDSVNISTPLSELPFFFDAHHHDATIRVFFDKSVTHFEVYKTEFYTKDRIDKHPITESVFYNRSTYHGRPQFKAIHEFYATVDGVTNHTVFMRGSVQFAAGGQVSLFGFIRSKNTLYYLIPAWLKAYNATNDNFDRKSAQESNVHLLIHITDDIDTDLFRHTSKAFHSRKPKSFKKYCGKHLM